MKITDILDEADEMLSMGFKKELDEILGFLSEVESKWLFSATMPDGIKQIVNEHMNTNAHRITVSGSNVVNTKIDHKFVLCEDAEKFNILLQFLNSVKGQRGIIFCRTKLGTQNLTAKLKEEGFSVAALEGDMQQKERDKVMRAFKNGTLQILISTDVSARGIDVNNLAFIIHHQLPEKLEYYTHRSGRTARAGKKGVSIALIIPSELQRIHEIQKELGIKFIEITV
mgnify:CR=1 FL=1